MRAISIALLPLCTTIACSDDPVPAAPPPRVLTTIDVSLAAAIEVGQTTMATAVGRDQEGDPLLTESIIWSSRDPVIAAVNPATGEILAIAEGTTEISATTEGKTGRKILTVSKAPAIRINEVQPRGDLRTGWIELINTTAAEVDVSGWTLIDNDFFGPTFTLPAGTVIAPGARFVIEEADLPFDLDAADSAHLFSRFGVSVDGATWVLQSPTTRSRCPDGTGAFIDTPPTKNAVNACP